MGKFLILFNILVFLNSCEVLNSPYPDDKNNENTLYTTFGLTPKHLDPAQSYSSNELDIIGQIYEPPLQYNYLKKPYCLEPLSANSMPDIQYLDNNNKIINNPQNDKKIKTSIYTIKIKPNIFYQPHPAFNERDSKYQLKTITTKNPIRLFTNTTNIYKRELIAEDFVYQIKRLAHPKLHSPIFSFMSKYIQGLPNLRNKINKKLNGNKWLDLRKINFIGAKVIDKYTYQIRINGKYPQFKLWLTMPFFAPIPWEAEEFYAEELLQKHNINLDWYPIGTGAFMLTVNNPNHKIVLQKNPNFHPDFYPHSTEFPSSDAGNRLPFLDKIVFTLEKESIPAWNKFLQGYYDFSGVNSDNFDYTVNFSNSGTTLTKAMQNKGIYLKTTVPPLVYYLGFNMLDPVVGGLDEQHRKLRQAISIAFDYEEYIAIFRNGQGIVAQSPIPPGIFGFAKDEKMINHVVYKLNNHDKQRRDLQEARQLLKEAGYPNGINPKTGHSLKLYLDGTSSGSSGNKAMIDWYKKQFTKLNIQLVIRSSDYNRFQDKMRKGKAQLFEWGWSADYPDPENFLFLLYGKNSKALYGGENVANYQNNQFDIMFEKMQTMNNSKERLVLIQKMTKLIQKDSPWIWGIYPKYFGLYHNWVHNKHSNAMAKNTLKYLKIDSTLRAKQRKKWNQPVLSPLVFIVLGVLLLFFVAFWIYQKTLRESIKNKVTIH